MNSFLSERSDGVALSIRLQPRASQNGIVGVHGSELKIRVTAPPVDAAANRALLALLATKLDCPRNAVEIVRGQTSRQKTVLVRGLSAVEIRTRLGV